MESAEARPDQPGLPGEPLHTLTRRMALTSLPLLMAAGMGKDQSMPWSSPVIRRLVVDANGTYTGVFLYSPTAGPGTLIASESPSAGTDPYGNSYLKGITTYDATYGKASLLGAGLTFYAPAGTTVGGINANTADQLVITPTGGQPVVFARSLATAVTGSLLEVQGPIAAQVVNAIIGGAQETWHPLTLAAGWSAVAGYATPSYRINVLGDVQMAGRITGTAGTGSNTLTGASLPSGYFSATNSYTVACSVSASAGLVATTTPRLTLTNTGAVDLNGISTSGTTVVDLAVAFPVSAG